MRNRLTAVFLTFFVFSSLGQRSSSANVSQLPDGTITGDIYSNDSLGFSYEFPNDWTPIADPKKFPPVDPQKPGGLANQCSKTLVWIQAPGEVEGRFSSVASLFVIDPGCFPGAVFPKSLSDKGKINKFADKIIKAYANTLSYPPMAPP